MINDECITCWDDQAQVDLTEAVVCCIRSRPKCLFCISSCLRRYEGCHYVIALTCFNFLQDLCSLTFVFPFLVQCASMCFPFWSVWTFRDVSGCVGRHFYSWGTAGCPFHLISCFAAGSCQTLMDLIWSDWQWCIMLHHAASWSIVWVWIREN